MIETPSTEELAAANAAAHAQTALANARQDAAIAGIIETLAGFLVATQLLALVAMVFGVWALGRAVF